MSEHTWFIVAIMIYMGAMLAIGYWSYKKTDQYDDFVLAGRDLNPFVAALSAGASDMSGWLLMGLPGALFVTGMSELWIAVGLLIGSWANWKWVAPRLRAYSEVANNSITLPSFFENRLMDQSRVLRIVSSIVIIVFFTFYVSSGMVSGGRYFESTFGSAYIDGMMIVRRHDDRRLHHGCLYFYRWLPCGFLYRRSSRHHHVCFASHSPGYGPTLSRRPLLNLVMGVP